MVRSISRLLTVVLCFQADIFCVVPTVSSDPLDPFISSERRPNIVFLVCESTDGRTWQEGYQNSVIPLPNIHKLASSPGGAAFHRHYANAPVCCPSRATLWSGHHAHRIPHSHGRGECAGMSVNGAWNNYEGLPRNYTNRIDQVLSRSGGYDVYMSGKQDFSEGGHTLNVRMGSWTKQVRFPYDMSKTGGWRYDYAEVCRSNGTVLQENRSAHQDDWNVLDNTLDWIRTKAANSSDNRPFFVYQGMNIVHPPYRTNKYYYDKIDPSKIDVPAWQDIKDMHPCDLQSSMLKGCIPSDDERDVVEQYYRRRNVRRIYYAMIAEFDAMVGRYMDAVKEAGLWDNTIFIVTSDHGDMQMEHRQTFKMTPYDASSSVPMVIFDPRRGPKSQLPVVVSKPTQLIDLFPTILESAGIPKSEWPKDLDGQSLLPLLDPRSSSRDFTRSFVVSQFHGTNLAMSWFLIVMEMPSDGRIYKLVQYGTGMEVSPQLFDLTSDPNEMRNLALEESYTDIVTVLDHELRSIVDYPTVARDVASYDRNSFRCWKRNVAGDWKQVIHEKNLRWTPSWDRDSEGAFAAVEDWLSEPDATILPCRAGTRWPPSLDLVIEAE